MSLADRIRLHETRVLSDDHYVLRKTIFSFRRADGTWQRMARETYDRGNGVAILLHDPNRDTIVLTRQFRYPAFVNGLDDLMIEVPAGLLDNAAPEVRIIAETEEETGFRITGARLVMEAFMSPGAVTEKISLFSARYTSADRVSAGGGLAGEGEDIEVFETTLDEALVMIATGVIKDAKTIILLQHAALQRRPA
jgi:nudix-type nucleoside diphosphatase (YffH/AdpP family)